MKAWLKYGLIGFVLLITGGYFIYTNFFGELQKTKVSSL